jgi:2-phospho-L-lactate guanylyltransferase
MRDDALAAAMAEDVIAAVVRARSVARVAVVCDDPALVRMAHSYDAEVLPDPRGGLNAAFRQGMKRPTDGRLHRAGHPFLRGASMDPEPSDRAAWTASAGRASIGRTSSDQRGARPIQVFFGLRNTGSRRDACYSRRGIGPDMRLDPHTALPAEGVAIHA